MRYTTHLLVDRDGSVYARMTTPEGEDPDLEPWMLYKVRNEGWKVRTQDPYDPGIATHGYADWRGVADNLATAVRVLISDESDHTDESAAAALEAAQAALDDYDVAVMEVSVAEHEHDEDDPDEEETDGSGG